MGKPRRRTRAGAAVASAHGPGLLAARAATASAQGQAAARAGLLPRGRGTWDAARGFSFAPRPPGRLVAGRASAALPSRCQGAEVPAKPVFVGHLARARQSRLPVEAAEKVPFCVCPEAILEGYCLVVCRMQGWFSLFGGCGALVWRGLLPLAH